MGKPRDPRDYLDSGDDNMPSEPNQVDAPGAQLLEDPGRTDSEHSNIDYEDRAHDPDMDDYKDKPSNGETTLLEDADEYPHCEKKNPFADKMSGDSAGSKKSKSYSGY